MIEDFIAAIPIESKEARLKRGLRSVMMMDFEEQRAAYAGVLVDLSAPRWVFLNTLFSLSEASLFAQGVDLLDAGKLPSGVGYNELFVAVRAAVDGSHRDGVLKADVLDVGVRLARAQEDLVRAIWDVIDY